MTQSPHKHELQDINVDNPHDGHVSVSYSYYHHTCVTIYNPYIKIVCKIIVSNALCSGLSSGYRKWETTSDLLSIEVWINSVSFPRSIKIPLAHCANLVDVHTTLIEVHDLIYLSTYIHRAYTRIPIHNFC